MVPFSTLKEKILSFLAQMGIRKSDFFEATGIQSSNFKGTNIKSAPGGDMLVRILTTYPNLSAEWLMRGEGTMLRSSQNIIPSDLVDTDPQSGKNYIPPTAPINLSPSDKDKNESLPPSALTELVGTIRDQAEEIGRLKARIEELERRLQKDASDAPISGIASAG